VPEEHETWGYCLRIRVSGRMCLLRIVLLATLETKKPRKSHIVHPPARLLTVCMEWVIYCPLQALGLTQLPQAKVQRVHAFMLQSDWIC